jgi:TatD DNase family protein
MNPLPFIDVHTHLYRPERGTVTVQNIFPGEGFAAFSGRNFYSVGLHPWHIKTPEENNEWLLQVEDAMEFDHVIFIGECGLDKKVENDFNEQHRIFEAQAFMSEEVNKPLIIHCVKAYNEVIQLYKKLHPQMPWIMHGYNGSLETTKQLVDNNFLFSFGGNLFKSGAKAIDSFKFLPLDCIFFETDEYEGDVEKMYQKGAELKNVPFEKLKEAVWKNFNRIENVSFTLI